LNSTSLSIDRLRSEGETFMEELSREYYLAHSGQKPTAELQPIYQRHAAILGPDALAMVLEQFRGAGSGTEEQRGLRLLTDWLVESQSARELASLDEREIAWEGDAVVKVEDGRQISYQRTAIELANSTDKRERATIEKARSALVQQELAPMKRERFQRERDITESLGLANGDPPNFLTAPGQVGFTPGGHKLIVTTKASGSNIDVFRVRGDGTLSAAPVMNPSATPVPFAFTFTPQGRLASGEAGASSLTTYAINGDGTLADPRSASDGQTALCWIVRARGFYYVSNTGSNDVSSFTVGSDGQPTLLAAVAAATHMGPIDLTASGRYLYVQGGSEGTLDEFRINGDGSLTSIGAVTGLPVGQEGIASN
jgi:hypothetical protein